MTFLEALHSGRTLLMDGAMGTELIRRRGHLGPTWRANLTAPDLVAAIHSDYAAAGAEVLLTNTLLLNPTHVSPDDVLAGGEAAVRIARSVAGPRWILGSLGPMSTKEPNFAHRDAVLLAAKALAGVDAVLLETCSDDSAFAAAGWIRECCPELPVLVSFAFAPGEDDKVAALGRASTNVAAVGVNCGRDQWPADVGRSIEMIRRTTTKPLFARPNAGTPHQDGEKWTYRVSPEEWAKETTKIHGLAMIGGCCGTTPEFVERLAASMRNQERHRDQPQRGDSQ